MTPEIVESVALYFCVPTEKEYGLALQIRMALEAYVDTQYTLTLVTRDLVDPMVLTLPLFYFFLEIVFRTGAEPEPNKQTGYPSERRLSNVVGRKRTP